MPLQIDKNKKKQQNDDTIWQFMRRSPLEAASADYYAIKTYSREKWYLIKL